MGAGGRSQDSPLRECLVLRVFLLWMILSPSLAGAVSVGGRVGLNFSFPKASPLGANVDTAGRFAFELVALLDCPVTHSFSIQPELRYSQRGGSASLIGLSGDLSIDYLELGVPFKYRLSPSPLVWFVSFGPALGFAVNREVELINLIVLSQKSAFKAIDLTAEGAFGAEYHVGRAAFLFQLRLNWGFMNLKEAANESYLSRTLHLEVGSKYQF